ncbi:MAG: 23S rRNA (guanosine(2251)-2'-O)-methyltransferase RlmB [Chlamydiales bacterium]|nr:23S rRNA (guanosine(2251)-2'-O)-methyltransferase RlmB [Chlamydiales bacterium]
MKNRPTPPPRDQLVMGVRAIQELLDHAPERIIRIYTVKASVEKKSNLTATCLAHKIPVTFHSPTELTHMVGSDSHQSLVAHIRGRKFWEAREFLMNIQEKKSSFVLMVDQIFDPQNFGALIRAAECLGADGIIWSKNRGSDLTATAAKASSGASELLPLLRVSNLAETVELFKKEGFEIVSSLLDPQAKRVTDFSFPSRTLLIVGSEGEGIQPLLRKKSDHFVYIPMKGRIESLNVSQAASILLYCAQASQKKF